MNIPPQLRTARLLLRTLDAADADRLASLAGERRISHTMISIPHPYTVSQAKENILRFSQELSAGTAFHFAVCSLADWDLFFGYVALKEISVEHSSAELSFWIDEAHSGRGYITEAAREVLRFGFRNLQLNRVCGHAMVRNVASARVLAKIGMRQEGCLREMVCKWGKHEDVSLWAIVRGDLLGC